MVMCVGSRSLPESIQSEISYKRKLAGIKDSGIQDHDFIFTQKEYDEFREESLHDIIHIQNKKYGYVVFLNGKDPYEIEIAERRPSSAAILHYMHDPLKTALLMKLSHRYLKNSPHFLKTMSDIKVLRKYTQDPQYGDLMNVNLDAPDILVMREKETYAYPHPNLNRQTVDFFSNNQAGYKKEDYLVYSHDDIHEAVKMGVEPAYKDIRVPGEDVKCSRDLFDKISYEQKLFCTYEEAATLALERHQIPNGFKYDPEKSFKLALEKVCTSITSGWFREFSWENYDEVLDIAKSTDYNYVFRFKEALKVGNVQTWMDLKKQLAS